MTNKILLDECVTNFLQYMPLHKQVGTVHHSVAFLGQGAKDRDIAEFAHNNGYLLVTRDFKFIIRCVERDINVALFNGGRAYVITTDQTINIASYICENCNMFMRLRSMLRSMKLVVSLRRLLTRLLT